MKLNCNSVSLSEAGDEIFQVIFREENKEGDEDDGRYLLLQRAFFEEDEDDEDDPCYIETHDVDLIGHYSCLETELKTNKLLIKFPPPHKSTIEVNFNIDDKLFKKLQDMLSIIFQ